MKLIDVKAMLEGIREKWGDDYEFGLNYIHVQFYSDESGVL